MGLKELEFSQESPTGEREKLKSSDSQRESCPPERFHTVLATHHLAGQTDSKKMVGLEDRGH